MAAQSARSDTFELSIYTFLFLSFLALHSLSFVRLCVQTPNSIDEIEGESIRSMMAHGRHACGDCWPDAGPPPARVISLKTREGGMMWVGPSMDR